MSNVADNFEKQACDALGIEDFSQAFKYFTKAAKVFDKEGSSQKAALCYASAASCWSKKSGEQTFSNAATSYESAAKQAELTKDYGYASMLYKYAAINYEREREFVNFSDCFYFSKECHRKFLMSKLLGKNKLYSHRDIPQAKGIKGIMNNFISLLYLSVSFVLWGHGERPQRTFFFAISLVTVAAIFYRIGNLLQQGVMIHPNFFESFYFSVVTFTTLGYGDFAPIGWTKYVVICEAFFGMFVMPLFFISLSRKYLRV